MSVIDYLAGNTDRHWGNWSFLVDNDTNRLEKLYPIMDFNKSFLAYDTLDGAICQTSAKRQSQREAAVKAEWFEDQAVRDMFFRRLSEMENAAAAGSL